MKLLSRARDESFSKFVRRLLIAKGMKNKDLCELTGLSRNTVSAILNEKPPSWESAEAIMSALDIRMVKWEEGFYDSNEPDLIDRVREIVSEYLVEVKRDGGFEIKPDELTEE